MVARRGPTSWKWRVDRVRSSHSQWACLLSLALADWKSTTHVGSDLIKVGSRARHLVSHLVAEKAGVAGDPLKAQVGSPIGELAQLL